MPEDGDKEEFIVNDVLCYVQCMIDTLHREQIVKSLITYYTDEQEARSLLLREMSCSKRTKVRHRMCQAQE